MIRFIIVGYEKETFGTSLLYPDIPEGRNKCLHRFTHIAFWFEWSTSTHRSLMYTRLTHPGLIPANVLLIVGGEYT